MILNKIYYFNKNMSLFIGNIAKEVTKKELEDLFSKYGKCEINYKGAYAFAEFSVDKEAEQAKLELNKKEVNGRVLSIEWSKKSKNYVGNERYENISSRRKCYTCGRSGHFARDCPEGRRRSNSRNYDDNKSLRSRSLNESNRSINDSHNNYNREEKNFVNDENNNMK